MIGKTAFDLYRDKTPQDLREEARFWVQGDGTMGTQVHYGGEKHGMHVWITPCGDEVMVKTTPPPMNRWQEERLEMLMKGYMEREHEKMVDERTNNAFSYQDYEVATESDTPA